MSSNLYIRELVTTPEESYYELKFLFRDLFEVTYLDQELTSEDLPILKKLGMHRL